MTHYRDVNTSYSINDPDKHPTGLRISSGSKAIQLLHVKPGESKVVDIKKITTYSLHPESKLPRDVVYIVWHLHEGSAEVKKMRGTVGELNECFAPYNEDTLLNDMIETEVKRMKRG